ncbi:glycosyltransferase family 2 protein [Xylanimonas ulmi]|uniref:Glycosyltransferase involved in cell wall biosynthesis n=1 Tax=Xylanimonas ulmi TaxID=228973 RepID=A0A4V2EXM1_9MICO|nr:glycosyltransferase family 2 protein [Xylanibacterium ulmi]RZS59970.1 glycosyltransferase involved in cell wall biosynthesis [Xylanibacterium ulmi]
MTSPPSQRVLIVLPAWNEEAAIAAVLDEVATVLPWADLLVVNDGSTDDTAAVARSTGRATIVDLPLNLGVGGAMRAGYKYAHRQGYDVAIQLDADGQHDPADVPRLLAAMREHSADLVIGARFAGTGSYEVGGPRRWAMRLLSWVLSRVVGTRLTDTTSGFKASGPAAIEVFAQDYPAEYLGDTVEALVIAARAHLRVAQVGVEMRERAAGAPSHNPLKAAVYLGRVMLALVVAMSRPMKPLHEEAR